MQRIVLLILQVILYNLCDCQQIGSPCQSDSDCNSYLACIDNTCEMCGKPGTTCDTSSLLECCKGTVCQPIAGSNRSACVPSSCECNEDCPLGFGCLVRLGKCGLCKNDGVKCTLPYDDLECCSGWCGIGSLGVGYCRTPTTLSQQISSRTQMARSNIINVTGVDGDVHISGNKLLPITYTSINNPTDTQAIANNSNYFYYSNFNNNSEPDTVMVEMKLFVPLSKKRQIRSPN